MATTQVQTKRVIQEMLRSADLRPLKQYGQHFLIDGNLMRKLVASAGIGPDDVVLEVGAGTGGLTELLLDAAGHVVSVEVDRGLAALCESRLGGSDRWTLLCRDALKTKRQIAPELLQVLTQRRIPGGRVMLVANLPYQMATPLVLDLAMGDLTVSPMCFTVQAEVADRLTSAPGSKAYGPVSVLLQASGRIQRVAGVPPEAFWPAPKVESAMLRVDVYDPRLPSSVRQSLARVVQCCFQHRRKTLRSSLKYICSEELQDRIASDVRWSLSDRPDQLNVTAWLALAELILSHPHS